MIFIKFKQLKYQCKTPLSCISLIVGSIGLIKKMQFSILMLTTYKLQKKKLIEHKYQSLIKQEFNESIIKKDGVLGFSFLATVLLTHNSFSKSIDLSVLDYCKTSIQNLFLLTLATLSNAFVNICFYV